MTTVLGWAHFEDHERILAEVQGKRKVNHAPAHHPEENGSSAQCKQSHVIREAVLFPI
jgi:hypothetical protein